MEAATRGKYDLVFSSHGNGVLRKEIIRNMLDVCHAIREGEAANHDFCFDGDEGIWAKEIANDTLLREDGICGNLIIPKEDPAEDPYSVLPKVPESEELPEGARGCFS